MRECSKCFKVFVEDCSGHQHFKCYLISHTQYSHQICITFTLFSALLQVCKCDTDLLLIFCNYITLINLHIDNVKGGAFFGQKNQDHIIF